MRPQAAPGAAPVGPNGMVPVAGAPEQTPSEQTSGCTEQGLELDGMMYSPGGTVLPHPCEPFHPTLNNPYAVRCIDAWPWFKTGFPGDEYCILPPEPGKGVQVGIHPQGMDWYEQVSNGDLSGYEGVDSAFLMDPGDEEERNYITGSPNTESLNYYRNNVRMRPGSHHMIVSAAEKGMANAPRGSWIGGSVGGLSGGNGGIPGSQRPDENTPQTLQKPPEDEGMYSVLGPDSDITFNMHHFNATDDVTLKESWTNLWLEENTTYRVGGIFGMPLTQVLGTFARPGQTNDMHYTWDVMEEVRIVKLFGHRHAWTSNFVVWIKKPDGNEEIVYQSFDWFEQPTYRYDSQQMNPVPMPEQLRDGGFSGVLRVQPGDELHMNCHIAFTDERAEAEGAPRPSSIGSLRFANQAFPGERPILFGATTEGRLGSPGAGRGPLPR
ncbi:MAG: hypothetical protein OXU20_40220, partial [Myxococcales bacterium]|nr:hypothetical protein [Myxococcales bacterium]